MKKIQCFLFTISVLLVPHLLQGQGILQGGNIDSTQIVTKEPQFYKTAEIAYEIENSNRYIKSKFRQIESYREISIIDTSFQLLSAQISNEFNDFNSFNKFNLSKFFLLNTKKVWLGYRSQLDFWQTDISNRIQDLIDVSDQLKEKEKRWIATSNKTGDQQLPEEIITRISNVISALDTLETDLFVIISHLSVLDSRIADQIIALDENIEIIDELYKNYRVNLLKSTRPLLWNVKLKGSSEGTVSNRFNKVWYENTKSLKDSMPSFKEYYDDFITWSLLIIFIIAGFRYLYLKHGLSKRSTDKREINKLIITHPGISLIYMVLFIFILVFSNSPQASKGIISILLLVITYFILQPYISAEGRRIIKTFIVLLILNVFEFVFWYFEDYARIYLLLEAGLGILLVSYFITRSYSKTVLSEFRYKLIVKLLRYPFFLSYVIALIVNLFGFQNLTVFLLKISTQISASIIIIIGAWEISKSIFYILFELLTRFKERKSHKHFTLIIKRLTLFLNIFFILIWFDTCLGILELDTLFYNALESFRNNERKIGSLIFTYDAIFQFMLIMLITWGLTVLIKLIFDEEHFKHQQRLRGVPAAISMTLRIFVALAGFFLALSGAGIDLTKISILIGAFGVGIGFGLQNIVNNFISGLILIYERPIQAGDIIEINNLLGEVKGIGIRSSKVRTYDGAEVVVPNSNLVSDQLINWTLSDKKRRLDIMIGVKYGTDPVKVIEILKQVAMDNELVSKEPEPRVLFHEFADSSLNFRLLCWVLFEHGIQTKSDLAIAIDKAFKENNIEIPFPQLDLHVIDTTVEKQTSGEQDKIHEDSNILIAKGNGLIEDINETEENQ